MGWIADLLKEVPLAARYKAELEAMEKENVSLKAEIFAKESELEILRTELQRYKQASGSLETEAEKILMFIARNKNTTAPEIARSLSIDRVTIDMHLEDLEGAGHVYAARAIYEETEYSIGQNGRRYLNSKRLL